jgi:hypothetical protein
MLTLSLAELSPSLFILLLYFMGPQKLNGGFFAYRLQTSKPLIYIWDKGLGSHAKNTGSEDPILKDFNNNSTFRSNVLIAIWTLMFDTFHQRIET